MYIRGKTIVSGSEQLAYHNYYSTATVLGNTASFALTPCVKLEYLLSRINIDEGYKFINNFQIDKELKWLYIFSNRDMRTSTGAVAPTVPAAIRLNDFLPSITVPEMLKRVCAQFCLGIYTNVFQRTMILEPLNAVIKKAAKYDWTAYAISQQLIDQTFPAPNYYNYNTNPDTPPPDFPAPEDVRVYNTIKEAELDNSNAGAVGTYFYAEGGLYKVVGWAGGIAPPQLQTAVFVTRGQVADNKERTPYDNSLHSGLSIDISTYNGGGVSRFVGTPDPTPTKWDFDSQDYPFQIMAYRGILEKDGGAFQLPVTSHSVYDADTAPATRLELMENGASVGTAKYSLFWHGDFGLYRQFHAAWSNMLRNGKPVTQQFEIPVSLLVSFQFNEKIRVGSMEYIASKLRVKKSSNYGKVIVEATLISII
jgi:hypothetical protein